MSCFFFDKFLFSREFSLFCPRWCEMEVSFQKHSDSLSTELSSSKETKDIFPTDLFVIFWDKEITINQWTKINKNVSSFFVKNYFCSFVRFNAHRLIYTAFPIKFTISYSNVYVCNHLWLLLNYKVYTSIKVYWIMSTDPAICSNSTLGATENQSLM